MINKEFLTDPNTNDNLENSNILNYIYYLIVYLKFDGPLA